ncbi:MAG TPA: LysM domain-containing protein, partial [Nakamurella sp.]
PVESVTVRPGDSLWLIAARAQGPAASDADIDNAWRAWYFTNQRVIGDDPDRIVPGQSLVVPTSGEQVRS